MNIQDLRQSLKLKWLNYYQKNHSWLVKMRVWATYDGERRPLSSFILATLSVLEPKLEQVFPFILELSNNPDQIIAALGLNFNPEQQLHLIDSHDYTNNNYRTQERSLEENLLYDGQPGSGSLSHDEMAQERAMAQNTNLMTMLLDEEEEVSDELITSSVAVQRRNKPSPDFVGAETQVAVLPTRTSPPETTVEDYSVPPPTEPPREKIPQSLPLHTFVLDEFTGIFHQSEPELRDFPQSPEKEAPAYTLGETICVPSIAADNEPMSPSSLVENQPEPEPEPEEKATKKKRFNLASWVDEFCQGKAWDEEDTIILPF